jgi:hypothetical protein
MKELSTTLLPPFHPNPPFLCSLTSSLPPSYPP